MGLPLPAPLKSLSSVRLRNGGKSSLPSARLWSYWAQSCSRSSRGSAGWEVPPLQEACFARAGRQKLLPWHSKPRQMIGPSGGGGPSGRWNFRLTRSRTLRLSVCVPWTRWPAVSWRAGRTSSCWMQPGGLLAPVAESRIRRDKNLVQLAGTQPSLPPSALLTAPSLAETGISKACRRSSGDGEMEFRWAARSR